MLTPFLVALSFLTIIPCRIRKEISSQAISNSRAYYPLIGLAIGTLLLIIEQTCSYIFPSTITAALPVAYSVGCSHQLQWRDRAGIPPASLFSPLLGHLKVFIFSC